MPRFRNDSEDVAEPPAEVAEPVGPSPAPAPPAAVAASVYRVADGKTIVIAGEPRHAGAEVRAMDVGGDEALGRLVSSGHVTKG